MPKETLPTMTIDVAKAEVGRQMFISKYNCVKCHPLDRYPGHDLLAPSILKVGLYSESHLTESILNPSTLVDERYRAWSVEDNGKVLAGIRIPNSAPDRLRLLTVSAGDDVMCHEFDVNNVECWQTDASPMPSYTGAISGDDLDCLVEFLRTLR